MSDQPPVAPAAGDTWKSPIDGMVLAYIPAGKFWMGAVPGSVPYGMKADTQEKPRHEVALDGFWIDTTSGNDMRASNRSESDPANTYDDFGFCCAR